MVAQTVKSKIDNSILYFKHKFDENDDDFESYIYDIEIGEQVISTTIGKANLTHSNKGILFFPIYSLSPDNKIIEQIGVFEVYANAADITKYTNENLEIDEEKLGEPLFFEKPEILAAAAASVAATSSSRAPSIIDITEEIDDATATEEEEAPPSAAQEEDLDDIFQIEVKKEPEIDYNDTSSYKIRNMSKIFSISPEMHIFPELPEETIIETKKYRREYEESAGTTWVEKFFKNNFFSMEKTPENGDCFFHAIKTAFEQIGYLTTIEKLREIVSSQVTREVFDKYQTLYQGFRNQITESTEIAKKLVSINKDLKKTLERSNPNDKEHKVILEKAKENAAEYETQKEGLRYAKKNLEEYDFMDGIDNIEKLKIVMQTSKYWGDEFAISVIEKALRIKIILLTEQDFKEGALDFVLDCGAAAGGGGDTPDFRPFFYIILSGGITSVKNAGEATYYQLVSYKSKKILKFQEIPHAIKILIMNKCIESLSGSYNKIPEFRALKQHYNIVDEFEDIFDIPEFTNETATGAAITDLYDKDTIFMFYDKSANKKVGSGTGEKIPPESVQNYLLLQKTPHWRRKLDDTYIGNDAVFEIDNKKWAAPEIYYQASKFRAQNPDFYKTFAIDAGTDYSKDVDLAKIAGSLEGKGDIKRPDGTKKTVILRNKSVKIDPGFYSVSSTDGLANNKKERRTALKAKFSQNPELKSILLATRRALLMQYHPRVKYPTPDVDLMEIREELRD